MKIEWGGGLSTLPLGARLGLTGLCIVLLGGLAASFQHMIYHYENRDERPEFSVDDVVGAYHGLNSPALLKEALENGHPETLPADQRSILIEWLSGSRIVEDYDSLDLEIPPAEILDEQCLQCHTRDLAESQGIPSLEYFDDIKSISFSREVEPTPVKILAASTHAHALSMSVQGMMVLFLALLTAWPTRRIGWICALMGLGLMGDIGGWWLARYSPSFVMLIMVSGAAYSVGQATLIGSILLDLWRGKKPRTD